MERLSSLPDEHSDKEDGYNSASTDDTVKVDSDSDTEVINNTENTNNSTDKSKSAYRCHKCNQVKKGHVCPGAIQAPETFDKQCSSFNLNPTFSFKADEILQPTPSISRAVLALTSDEDDKPMETTSSTSFPIGSSLGWFDLAANSLSNLHQNLKKIPSDEWEHLEPLTSHLEGAVAYFKIMQAQFALESTYANDNLVGNKRTVSEFLEGSTFENIQESEEPPTKQQRPMI